MSPNVGLKQNQPTNVDGYSSSPDDDVDNMSVYDVEYEFGDLPDSAYEYYNEWILKKQWTSICLIL